MRVPSPPNPAFDRAPAGARSFGILSTYPPTACGLATFSAALAGGLAANGAEVSVVRVADGSSCSSARVVGELVNGSARSVAASAELLNECDVAVVQHEYGLYGGADGDEVVEILGDLRIPSIVIAHTILLEPTPHQRSVLVAVAEMADRVVVMSEAARERLCALFDVDPAKVDTIPHGAVIPHGPPPFRSRRPADLADLGPARAGQGHRAGGRRHGLAARVRRAGPLPGRRPDPPEGARRRRRGLPQRPHRAGLAQRRRGVGRLRRELPRRALPHRADPVLRCGRAALRLPGPGRPPGSWSTPSPPDGRSSPPRSRTPSSCWPAAPGIVVDHDDPDALAVALRRVLTEPNLAASMAAEASRLAPSMGWPVVARAYLDLAERLLVDHVLVERAALV